MGVVVVGGGGGGCGVVVVVCATVVACGTGAGSGAWIELVSGLVIGSALALAPGVGAGPAECVAAAISRRGGVTAGRGVAGCDSWGWGVTERLAVEVRTTSCADRRSRSRTGFVARTAIAGAACGRGCRLSWT